MKNAGDFMKNAGARSVLRDTTGFQRANTKGKLLRTNDSTSSNKIQGEKWGL